MYPNRKAILKYCKYITQGVECANNVTDAAFFTSEKEFNQQFCWGHIGQMREARDADGYGSYKDYEESIAL